jgi:hypothetical protein
MSQGMECHLPHATPFPNGRVLPIPKTLGFRAPPFIKGQDNNIKKGKKKFVNFQK